MGYAAGVITLDSSPTTTLLSAIEALLTAHSGWSFVEDRVISTTNVRVWKCKGTTNSFGQDWYLIFRRSTSALTTGPISVTATEGYDSATGNCVRSLGLNGTSYTPDGTTSALVTASTAASTIAVPTGCVLTAKTSTMYYQALVTKDGIYLRSADGGEFYVGLFTSYFAAEWPTKEFPLVASHLATTSSGYSAKTRAAGGSGSASNWGLGTINRIYQADPPSGTVGSPTGGAGINNGKARGGRASVMGPAGAQGVLPTLAWFNAAAEVTYGDTVTIDGDTWACISPSTSQVAGFMNAAAA